jgi:aspartyl-tRNA(Asn)/glutamyl-tRNA(Gln) amidotransferase subunit A
MTLATTAQAIRRKEQSAEEAVQASLDAIARWNDPYGAFLQVEPDRALARAREVDAALASGGDPGPLAGVPLALKDNLCTTFGVTSCASRILEGFRSPYNAHVVDRLEEAGAVVVGKTNLDEFAMGSSSETSALAVTRNPWNAERVPGGSSGGSAAAVALDLVPGALGSDTGGSIRQPASFCGVVGLKPTYGRVSRYGLVAFASSLDQIGPLARTAEDAALLLGAIAGYDPRDSTSVDRPVPDYTRGLGRPLEGLRVGIAAEYFGEGLDDEVRTAVEGALAVLREHGAEVREIRLPHTPYAIACYYLVATAEASSNLARYDGVHYGYRTAGIDDVIDMYSASRRDGFGPEVKRRIMLGTYALSSGYYDAYYLKALKVRTLLRRDFEEAFRAVDLIASPVAPTSAFGIGEKTGDPLAMYLADVYTTSVNLAGIPAVSLPCGFDSAGMPVGLQLMGPAFGEEVLLAAAHQYQQVTDHHLRRPPVVNSG